MRQGRGKLPLLPGPGQAWQAGSRRACDAPEERLHALGVARRPHPLGQPVKQHKRKGALHRAGRRAADAAAVGVQRDGSHTRRQCDLPGSRPAGSKPPGVHGRRAHLHAGQRVQRLLGAVVVGGVAAERLEELQGGERRAGGVAGGCKRQGGSVGELAGHGARARALLARPLQAPHAWRPLAAGTATARLHQPRCVVLHRQRLAPHKRVVVLLHLVVAGPLCGRGRCNGG